MNPHLWLAFVLACLVMGAIPGPGVMTIVGTAIGSGRAAALASVAGMAVGNIVAMSLSMAGAGALLAASATAFHLLKWAGALYLIGLGILAIARTRQSTSPSSPRPRLSPRAAFANTVAIGTFHPKTIVFFVAFAPQFLRPEGSYTAQAAILILTFTLVVGCTDTLYAVAASKASHLLARPGATRWAGRASGGVLIVAGVATGVE
jgi:threonine/homoserine/homoserine lactone efflux protein